MVNERTNKFTSVVLPTELVDNLRIILKSDNGIIPSVKSAVTKCIQDFIDIQYQLNGADVKLRKYNIDSNSEENPQF